MALQYVACVFAVQAYHAHGISQTLVGSVSRLPATGTILRPVVTNECTPYKSRCPARYSAGYYALRSDCYGIRGAVVEMRNILTEMAAAETEARRNEESICADTDKLEKELAAFEKEEEREQEELNCMVNEMQKRRDDDLRVQAQLKLPVDAARRQKRATTSFRSATKIDSLKSKVTGFKFDLAVRSRNLDSKCARAKSDFFKDMWQSPYDPDINDDPDDTSGQTSGEYYRSKANLLKRRSNSNIRSYGYSTERYLIQLFARPIVTATELKRAVSLSQQAVNNAKLLCKCCVSVYM